MINNFHRYIAISVLIAATTSAASWAQQSTNNNASSQMSPKLQGKVVVLPAGTTFEGTIDTKIGSSGSHPQEHFTITITNPVLVNSVDVLIPAGSQVLGEVVEAISSGHQEHHKNMPKPLGKLRVQLTNLKLADGTIYPLVASLAGDSSGSRSAGQSNVLGGVGYVGSPASFDAPSAGARNRTRTNNPMQRPNNPMQSTNNTMYNRYSSNANFNNGSTIRSLVRHEHDIYIYKGSPLTIRLDAPLKMTLGSAPASTSPPTTPATKPDSNSGSIDQPDTSF